MVLLELRRIKLSYNAVAALAEVNLDLKCGEIHAMLGEHGAGKSSLAHIIAGLKNPSGGTIHWKGALLDPLTLQSAMARGIRIVPQHNPLNENMTVADNILLNQRAGLFPLVTKKKLLRRAQEFLDTLGFDLDPGIPLSDLPLADRALVNILQHLHHDPELLIMDETLEKLSSEDLIKILKILRRRTGKGMTVLFISHRIDDIYNIAHRVTIIRDGKSLMTEEIDHIDKIHLIRIAYTHALHGKEIQTRETFNQIIRYNEAIITDLPVSLVVLNTQGRVRLMNRSAKNLLGACKEGESLLEIIEGDNTQFREIIETSFGNRTNRTWYQIPLVQEGESRFFNLTICPILERSTLLGNILILVNITEQKQMEEKLTLSENLTSLGLLAAGVAHEINNPLDIMSYYLANLRFSNLSKPQLKSLRGIEEEIESVAQIVGSLMTFSAAPSKEEETFDLGELVNSLTELLRFRAEEVGIKLEFQGFAGKDPVRANRNEIKQVLLNLTRNAFDAMETEGSLTLILNTAAETTTLTLADTGPGIPEEKMRNIFVPFFSTKAETGRNMGLGLSVSYGIVQKYGGVLQARNRAGGGCVFELTLPSSKRNAI